AGYAPVIGNHGVSGLVMMSAGALALLAMQRRNTGGARLPAALKPLLLVAVIWLLGAGLKTIDWTQPQGQAITVGIVQGNVPQSIKWRKSMRQPTLDRYRQLTAQLPGDIDLIIWPETAVPDFWYRVQPYIRDMKQRMQARNSDLLLGIFVKNDDLQLLNSVLNVNGESYHKRHLVPLGEFIPLRFLIDFFRQWVDIPMSDIASGEEAQPLLTVKGIPLGLSICFEEAFARDVLTTLPQAQILVNLSNDAWFEDSHEPHQHHVIARMRALESGRYMVRSTNTGISAIIDPKGKVISRAPQFEVAVLTGRVQPYSGSTPYVVWGDYFILLICLSALVFCWVKGYTFKKA
ncbi:MAG TPA: apolipoprotein N-acyltransferase, partial [Thiotrichales bacterium]|nr:apolipoprotein N-acyltransferase [Thiotrichales bacterium]